MKKAFDARRLDVRRFAEEGGVLAAEEPIGAFARLKAESQDRGIDSPVRWSAHGEIRNPGHVQPDVWLHVEAEATLPLVCQRCLAGVDVKIDVDRWFRFVSDEATAAAQDDEAEEDVLAESRSFDLAELVEDELLMGLPVVPRHVICPVLPTFSAGEAEFDEAQEKRENPFQLLAKLKPGKH
jgi:uncharacterized protein